MQQPLDWPAIENEALDIFRALLSIDTSNPPGNEAPAIAYACGLLAREGLQPVVAYREPARQNLVLRLPGRGTGPSLLLDAHLDVVPATEGDWTVPPFAAQARDDCIWGRGALDMKHMAAMSLAVVLAVRRHAVPLAGDLVLALTADEENGTELGAGFLASEHPDLIKTDFALGEVGGITMHVNGHRIYPVQAAERGICWLRLTVEGPGGHGSVPRANAVPEKIARILSLLSSMSFPIAPHPAAAAFLDALRRCSAFPQSVVLAQLKSGGAAAALLLDRVVPEARAAGLRAMLANTLQPTVVRCGERVNVVPPCGEILVDCRTLPGVSPDEMLDAVRRKVGPFATVALVRGLRGGAVSHDNPLYEVIETVVGRMDPGALVTPWLTPGFTNGSAYASLGIMYMGFTPILMPPTLDFVPLIHAPDERCPIAGFKWGVRTLYEVVTKFLAVR